MSFEDKQTTCSDCWITARNAERERIIKLIKKNVESWVREEDWHILGNQELIALIKGENQ